MTVDRTVVRVLLVTALLAATGLYLQARHGKEVVPRSPEAASFPSQSTGDTIHSPKNCLPGSGWTPMETSYLQVPLPGRPPLRVNRYVIAQGSARDLVLYWYQAHGRTTPSEYWARLYLVADAIRMNRTDGALVRIITPIAQGETTGHAQERAIGFAQQVVPAIDNYIPN